MMTICLIIVAIILVFVDVLVKKIMDDQDDLDHNGYNN
jgi:hypothetical protein